MDKKPDCKWNQGKLDCCGRICCELLGDDVSPDFHEVCLMFDGGEQDNIGFARSMVNEFYKRWKKKDADLTKAVMELKTDYEGWNKEELIGKRKVLELLKGGKG